MCAVDIPLFEACIYTDAYDIVAVYDTEYT